MSDSCYASDVLSPDEYLDEVSSEPKHKRSPPTLSVVPKGEKTLIYQVAVGKQSDLYTHCIASVGDYAQRINSDHIVQTDPLLKIRPDPGSSGRSKEAVERLGYLPIFEKESAFGYIDAYDKIAVIDADIYVRPSTLESIFDEFQTPWGAVRENDLPMLPWYREKLKTYSRMQYGMIWSAVDDFTKGIANFYNMGVMCFTCQELKPFLKSMTPLEFLTQKRFKDFVDGRGNWKWSTDQTLLNYWLKEDGIHTTRLHWKWNCLYKTVDQSNLQKANFVHFFLKDKLPNRGENVKQLMWDIGEC